MNPAPKPPWWFGIVKPLATAALRHGTTAVAGVLVSVGALQSDQQTQFVAIASGIAVWLVGYAWAAYSTYAANQKKQAAVAVAVVHTLDAVNSPTPTPDTTTLIKQAQAITGGPYKGDVPI